MSARDEIDRGVGRLSPAIKFFNAVAILGIIAVFSGALNDAEDYARSIVIIRTSLDPRLTDATANLSADDLAQVQCLAENNYFEARDQGKDGMRYVSHVVLNRMRSGLFPKKACAVVSQCDSRTKVCQFSWVNDGRDHAVREHAPWNDAYEVALLSWLYRDEVEDPTGGATRYMNQALTAVRWRGWRETASIGAHTFFKEPQR